MAKNKVVEQKHPRFTNEELEMVKETFAENNELIKVCYKVFFQLPLTEEEEEARKNTFKGECLRGLLDKMFCPGLENEQIFFGIDEWADVQLGDGNALLNIDARELSSKYLTQQLKVLFGSSEEEIKFKEFADFEGKTDEEKVVNILARKEIVGKVRQLFGVLQTWAGTKTESKEEMMKRLFSDSAK